MAHFAIRRFLISSFPRGHNRPAFHFELEIWFAISVKPDKVLFGAVIRTWHLFLFQRPEDDQGQTVRTGDEKHLYTLFRTHPNMFKGPCHARSGVNECKFMSMSAPHFHMAVYKRVVRIVYVHSWGLNMQRYLYVCACCYANACNMSVFGNVCVGTLCAHSLICIHANLKRINMFVCLPADSRAHTHNQKMHITRM